MGLACLTTWPLVYTGSSISRAVVYNSYSVVYCSPVWQGTIHMNVTYIPGRHRLQYMQVVVYISLVIRRSWHIRTVVYTSSELTVLIC